MLLKANSANETLRQSFVPMGDNIYQGDIQSVDEKARIGRNILSRYHDESYIVKNSLQVEIIRDPLLHTYRRLTRKLSVINPESALLAFWNILIEIAILFHFCEIPTAIFFTSAVY